MDLLTAEKVIAEELGLTPGVDYTITTAVPAGHYWEPIPEASFNMIERAIWINPNADSPLVALAHEMRHAWQYKQGQLPEPGAAIPPYNHRPWEQDAVLYAASTAVRYGWELTAGDLHQMYNFGISMEQVRSFAENKEVA